MTDILTVLRLAEGQFNWTLKRLANKHGDPKIATPLTYDEQRAINLRFPKGTINPRNADPVPMREDIIEAVAAWVLYQRTTAGWPTKNRYSLHRYDNRLGANRRIIGWMLCNPSTATDATDDPTIRRVMDFSKRENATEIILTNLVPYRATDPRKLDKVGLDDAFGQIAEPKHITGSSLDDVMGLNDPDDKIYEYGHYSMQIAALNHMFMYSDVVVMAWGNICAADNMRKHLYNMGMQVLRTAYRDCPRWQMPPIYHLGLTKTGAPRHPLYLAKETPLILDTGLDKLNLCKDDDLPC